MILSITEAIKVARDKEMHPEVVKIAAEMLADAYEDKIKIQKRCGLYFEVGDRVRKIKGSRWQGKVVGFYSTELTPYGYAVESETEHGSVQIYPACALELVGE